MKLVTHTLLKIHFVICLSVVFFARSHLLHALNHVEMEYIRDTFTLQHYNHHLFLETLWTTALTQYCLFFCSKSNNTICKLELSKSISNNQMLVNNKFK